MVSSFTQIADQRHVEQHQQDIADPEAGDQAPEDVGMLGDQLRPRHDALGSSGAEQHRHDGIAGIPRLMVGMKSPCTDE